MAHRCPTCMADISDVLGPFCPECGASRREGHDDEPGALYIDEPITALLDADPPDGFWDTAPRCLCSHSPSSHSAATGKCWSVACGCTAIRLDEAS